jgi:hypothetical protein
MGNKNAQGRLSARRVATFLAALGALVMSSGIALMVVATPANATADPKIVVCKYVSTPGGELQGGGNPIEVSLNTLKNVVDSAWLDDPNRTFPKSWNDAQGQGGGSTAIGYTGNGLDITNCPGYVDNSPALDATASVDITDPSCANENTPSYDVTATHATWEVVDSDVSPDGFVTVKFTATQGHAFADESTEQTITKDFGPAADCQVDGPRLLTPQEPSFTDPTCTTDPSVTLPSAPAETARMAAASLPPSVDVNGIHYAATGDLVAGGTVTVDATLLDPETTTFGEAKHSWSHTFTTPTGCTQVSPPTTEGQVVVNAPKTKTPKTTSTVTPTVVEAGLVGTSAQDLRGEQGLALMVAGMVMLVAAGGLGLRVRGAAARI